MQPKLPPLNPHALKGMLADGGELAIIDVREELVYSQGHLLFARIGSAQPAGAQFPAPGSAARNAHCTLRRARWSRRARCRRTDTAGYSNLFVLDGGVASWADAGLECSPASTSEQAFASSSSMQAHPSISAEELDRMILDGSDLVVLDSRPYDEYHRVSIPTAITCRARSWCCASAILPVAG